MQEIEMPKDKDAIALLKSDHEKVKKLFKEIEAEEDQEATFDQIKGALEVHATIEEEIFYPAVKKARSEEVKDEVREAYEEHKQVKALLAAIAEISPDDESYSSKIKVLKEDVEHHVKEEEGEMFPDARKYLRGKLEDLGAQMQARKDELETNGVLESKHKPAAERGGRSSNGKSKEA
jgi:iron-sulfur cluster repair protein YtfE (RIC family)